MPPTIENPDPAAPVANRAQAQYLGRTVVYSPESSVRRPGQVLRDIKADIVNSRELAFRLLVRNLKGQFRQTLMGWAWLFLPPLVQTAVWTILNYGGVVSDQNTSLPYPVFVLIGQLLFDCFRDLIYAPLRMVESNQAMMIKVRFPREAPILAGVVEAMINNAIRLVILIPIVFMFMPLSSFSWTFILFPVGYLAVVLMGTAFGLLFMPIGMLYKDIGRALGMFIQFGMFITPVVYAFDPMRETPNNVLDWINVLNPLSYVINPTRMTLTGFPVDYVWPFVIVVATACLVICAAWIIVRVSYPHLIARMGM